MYTVAYAPKSDPSLISFASVEVLASHEEEAYDLGFANVTLGDQYTRLNDYVVEIRGRFITCSDCGELEPEPEVHYCYSCQSTEVCSRCGGAPHHD